MSSQSEQVKSAIIEQIRSGIIGPGDSIDSAGLMKSFGISSTPVRDAINQLEALGIVERTPRAGVRVFQPDTSRLLGLIEIYAELEGMCARFAAKRITAEQAERLTAAVQACEDKVAEPNFASLDYYSLNMTFHLAILDAANNPDLFELMYISATRLISFFRARHQLVGEPERSAVEHRQITNEILAGNPDAARDLTIKHVQVDGSTIFDTVQLMKHAKKGSAAGNIHAGL
jgi:DNA-binding GntR family transcriptional regulator